MPTLQDILDRNRARFLGFLTKRLGDEAAAEDVLQGALLRACESGIPAENEEGAVTWFYRVLRNALVDHYRRSASESRGKDALTVEIERVSDPELEATVCACVNDLVLTLKAEYAEIVRAVDLDDQPVSEVASSLRVTPNNAMVRLHRARRSLKERLISTCGHCAEGGCLDCSCNKPAAKVRFVPR